MKKLVFMFVTFVALSFAACGGNTTGTAAADSTATDTVDTIDTVEVVDTVAVDTTAAVDTTVVAE